MARDVDLFNQPLPDVFYTARARYGLWPMTVWDLDHTDPVMRSMKRAIGDAGQVREVRGERRATYKTSLGASANATSIFNPVLATVILNMYGPPRGSRVLDPFAGGGTRAILCAKRGYEYHGIELRRDEALEVKARCQHNGVPCEVVDPVGGTVLARRDMDTDPEAGVVVMHVGDCRKAMSYMSTDHYDFLLTCPPYWTLEVYSNEDGDMSSDELSYRDYVEAIQYATGRTVALLKKGARSCWVIGLTRARDGNIRPLNHVVAEAHRIAGFHYAEEVVLAMRNTGAIQRVGTFERGQRHLVRTHEYLEVFVR